jgi:hypothetical protein
MRNPSWRISRGLVIGLLLVFMGCGEQTITELDKTQDAQIQKIVDLGFRADMIEDMGSYFRVEGDIIFEKADLSTVRSDIEPSFQSIVNAQLGRSIAVYIVVDLRQIAAYPEWVTGTRQAMTEWNNLSGSLVKFRENAAFTPQITVSTYTQVCTTCALAMAQYPTGGNSPGKTIKINLGYRGGAGPNGVPTAASKVHILAHEFGHTVGFRHTDWRQRGESVSPGANLVPGTTENDPASIMISTSGNRNWAGFSYFDRVAIRKIYLGFGPVPTGSVQGGRPVLTWPAMTEAQSYNVRYVTPKYDPELGYWIDGFDTFVGTTSALSFVDGSRSATRVGTCTDASPGYYVQTNFPAGITSYGWGGRICFF